MKKIKEISKHENLTGSAFAFDARQKVINKVAEGNIIMKAFARYRMAALNILNSRKMQVAKNNQDVFRHSSWLLCGNLLSRKRMIDKFVYVPWRTKLNSRLISDGKKLYIIGLVCWSRLF